MSTAGACRPLPMALGLRAARGAKLRADCGAAVAVAVAVAGVDSFGGGGGRRPCSVMVICAPLKMKGSGRRSNLPTSCHQHRQRDSTHRLGHQLHHGVATLGKYLEPLDRDDLLKGLLQESLLRSLWKVKQPNRPAALLGKCIWRLSRFPATLATSRIRTHDSAVFFARLRSLISTLSSRPFK